MRGGAQVKEALGVVTLLWNHPVLTGLLILIFTPPFFPLVVYFSPLLMSTALCVVALVSVGSQMEKIKAEGGPGQLEDHLAREQGVSTWVPRDRPGNESMAHHYGQRDNHHRNLFANISVVPVTPSWAGGTGSVGNATSTRAVVQLRPEPVEAHPPSPAASESDEDWWDTWVKEYESRPGWGEQEDRVLPTPAIQTLTTSQAPAPAAIPTPVTAREASNEVASSMAPLKPVRQESREDKPPSAPVAAPIAAPTAAPVSAPVSAPVVNRQELLRSLPPPPPPPTSTSRSQEEVVEAVKESDLRSHISLAPIRTGREKHRDVRQVDRIHKRPQEMRAVSTRSVDMERVTDVQALQSIEKLLYMEMGGSTPPISLPRNAGGVVDVKNAGLGNSSGTTPQGRLSKEATSPHLNAKVSVLAGKGHAVEASEKNRNKIAVGASPDVAVETPLLRHLKTSRSEKQTRSSAYSPLPTPPLRTSRGLMSEKVLPPPQFSPRLLQSLQPLPPKGLSPRLLPNLSSAPLGNPVEKIPQWVYDGVPKERAESRVKQAETAEEEHIKAFEQAVKVLSNSRRRTHARRPSPTQVDTATLQARSLDVSTPNTPGLLPAESVTPATTLKETIFEQTSGVSLHMTALRAGSPHRAAAVKPVAAESPPTRILEDIAVERTHRTGDRHVSSAAASPGRATLPTYRASAAFSPRLPPSVAASPRGAVAASSPHVASSAATSRHEAMVAASPSKASIAPSPRLPSPQRASIAASPRLSSSAAASPHEAMVAASTQKAPIAASPRLASVASSPGHRSSVPSSPSKPHSRRRRHSSKYSTDKVPLVSSSPHRRIEGSTYYDAPQAAEKEKVVAESAVAGLSEEYVPIENEVRFLPSVQVKEILASNCTPEDSIPAADPEEGALHWGRSHSARRSSPTRKSRRRLEPRRVVTSQDTDMFSLKKSLPLRNGQTIKFVDTSSDDEHESVTPRASRSLGRTIKPLVWRSRSLKAQEDTD